MYYPFIPSLVDPCPKINFLLVFQTFYKKKIKNLKSTPKTNSYLIIPFKVKFVPVHFNNVLYGLNSCVPHKVSPVRMTTLKNPALKGIFINTLYHNNLLYLCFKGRLLKWQIPKWAIFQGVTSQSREVRQGQIWKGFTWEVAAWKSTWHQNYYLTIWPIV